MLLLRSLLSLVVVVCAAPPCAAQWPCPESSDISPCTCTASADFEMTMDCSYVQNSNDLELVFQTPFPFSDFKQLIIEPVSPSSDLVDLPAYVFGPVTFQEVDISNTLIRTVDEETFAYSHDTLLRLNMGGNRLEWFPVETIELYVELERLDLSDNSFNWVWPNIESQSLTYLDLSGNTGSTLTEMVFTSSPYLQELRLNNMDLRDTTPPNVFLSLTNLKRLYLQDNGIPDTLIENFINTDSQPITAVYLDGNSISQIHPLSVTGLNSGGTISFYRNQIQTLDMENWGVLVSQLTLPGAIDMRDNPLVCGCDVYWLLLDASALGTFDSFTSCSGGNLVIDLPVEGFEDRCDPPTNAQSPVHR